MNSRKFFENIWYLKKIIKNKVNNVIKRKYSSNILKIPSYIFLTSLLIIPAISIQAFADASIELTSYDKSIGPNDSFLVIGKISGATPWKPVSLQVYDPTGNVIYSPNISFDGDGNFKYMINSPLPNFSQGIYTVEVSHPDSKLASTIHFTVHDGSIDTMDPRVIPEFGPMVMGILIVTISAIIMISKKNLIGIPKI